MKLTRALQLSKDSFPSGIDSKEIYITHIVWSTCGYMRLWLHAAEFCSLFVPLDSVFVHL